MSTVECALSSEFNRKRSDQGAGKRDPVGNVSVVMTVFSQFNRNHGDSDIAKPDLIAEDEESARISAGRLEIKIPNCKIPNCKIPNRFSEKNSKERFFTTRSLLPCDRMQLGQRPQHDLSARQRQQSLALPQFQRS